MHRLQPRKPWRKKPAAFLRYWDGRPDKRTPVKSILVYCLGEPGKRCGHSSAVQISTLPEWTWAEISAHLRCTKCGTVGYVDTRPNWPSTTMGTDGKGRT